MSRLALVTGGSKGIGAATARKLAKDGFHVLIIARNEPPITALCVEIRSRGGEASGLSCDITNSEDVAAALDRIQTEWGAPAILVNNAGFGGPFHRADEVTNEEWETIFATNVRAPFWFCRNLLPKMKSQGFGRVINIGSVQSLRGAARSSTYVATKHALLGYTKALACEWGQWGITCNIICPGYVKTEMLVPDFEDNSGLRPRIPAGRFAQPEEIAEAVSFLAAGNAAYINGAVLTIDGGLIAGYVATPGDLF
jgi:3-oxoacyl-[acyl-carrier protein] reductase